MNYIVVTIAILVCTTSCFASSTDAARVVGDLKVDGIHFSDSSSLNSANGLFKDKGTWLSSNLYSVGDVVQSGGSSYVCNAANTNILPPNPSYWSVLAAQGLKGDKGDPGITGTFATGTTPNNPVPGQIYFDTITKSSMLFDGSTWKSLTRNVSYASGISPDATDDGYLYARTLVFNKLWPSSSIRITWSDNLRVLGPNASCQWEVHVDGVSTTPQLKTSLYVQETGDIHRQSTLIGYATGVSAGFHTIKINVSRPYYPSSVCYTGWESTFLLEAEEIAF